MIELTPLARPYAKAIFASANDSKNLDGMAEELKIMAAASKTEGGINTIENPVFYNYGVQRWLFVGFPGISGKNVQKAQSRNLGSQKNSTPKPPMIGYTVPLIIPEK